MDSATSDKVPSWAWRFKVLNQGSEESKELDWMNIPNLAAVSDKGMALHFISPSCFLPTSLNSEGKASMTLKEFRVYFNIYILSLSLQRVLCQWKWNKIFVKVRKARGRVWQDFIESSKVPSVDIFSDVDLRARLLRWLIICPLIMASKNTLILMGPNLNAPWRRICYI